MLFMFLEFEAMENFKEKLLQVKKRATKMEDLLEAFNTENAKLRKIIDNQDFRIVNMRKHLQQLTEE